MSSARLLSCFGGMKTFFGFYEDRVSRVMFFWLRVFVFCQGSFPLALSACVGPPHPCSGKEEAGSVGFVALARLGGVCARASRHRAVPLEVCWRAAFLWSRGWFKRWLRGWYCGLGCAAGVLPVAGKGPKTAF